MMTFRQTVAAVLLVTGLMSAPQIHAQIPAIAGQSQDIPTLAPLLKRVTPSVVSIAVRRPMSEEERALMEDPMFQGLVPPLPPGERNIYAAGSGVIIDARQGIIATGAHVVDDADEIMVILADGRRFPATAIGSDAETDVAVVKVRVNGLTAITMTDSDRVEVGDFVLAIGNTFSLGQTVTSGIVSAIRRRSYGPAAFEDFIQTDAAINLGSSGGALINLRGELVGMNAAVLDMGETGMGNVGIGFAIPVNTVRSITNQLIKYGSATHGHLGVTVSESGRSQGGGLSITQIEAQSGAAQAGLRIGDVITTINGAVLRDPADLYIKASILRVGEVVELSVIRDGRAIAVRATLGAARARSSSGLPAAQSGPLNSPLRGTAGPGGR
jgi:serine protease Do/serine protease DegQ